MRYANDWAKSGSMKSSSLNIFQYACYRAFLTAYSAEKKQQNPHWSFGLWAKNLGLAGTASLTMVLNGQRNPGRGMAQKFLDYFKFNKCEAEYFQDLIRLKKVENDPRLSVLLMEKLAHLGPHVNFIKISSEQLRVISGWHYYAIREMIHLADFREDADWIVARLNFKLTAREVTKAINDLLALGLLARGEQGELVCSFGSLDTESDVASECLKKFHEEMIGHARTAIRKTDVKNRSINGMTLTINQVDLAKAKELICRFQDDLCKLMEVKNGDATYQCNIQFFPLTRDMEESQ